MIAAATRGTSTTQGRGGGSVNALGRVATDQALDTVVRTELELEWSPQQIAAHLRLTYPDRVARLVCHETIYQALCNGSSGLSRALTRRLRSWRPLRKRRRRLDRRAVRFLTPRS